MYHSIFVKFLTYVKILFSFYVHNLRKQNSIKHHNKGIHLPKPNSKNIHITLDKASNFQLINPQAKGTTKDLTFFNFLVRLPKITESENSGDEEDWVDIDATSNVENTESTTDQKKVKFDGSMVCYIYFFDSKKELSIAEVVVQLQKKLKATLKIDYPDHTLTWISDGCKSECKGNDFVKHQLFTKSEDRHLYSVAHHIFQGCILPVTIFH